MLYPSILYESCILYTDVGESNELPVLLTPYVNTWKGPWTAQFVSSMLGLSRV